MWFSSGVSNFDKDSGGINSKTGYAKLPTWKSSRINNQHLVDLVRSFNVIGVATHAIFLNSIILNDEAIAAFSSPVEAVISDRVLPSPATFHHFSTHATSSEMTSGIYIHSI